MEVSVVITTYQRPDLAKRAIKSAVNQTYTPSEILVIEDASNSGIEGWIEEHYQDITYIKNSRNLGLAGSRNKGMERAHSDWIAFLDDDDEWLPDRLSKQVHCYEQLDKSKKKDLACIQVGTKHINSEGKVMELNLPRNRGNLAESIKEIGARTPSSSFLFKKSALEHVGGFDEELISGIDHDIWMKLAVAGFSNEIIKEPLVVIHEDEADTMMTDTGKRIKGLKQYIGKWTPTYREWFGEKEGEEYARTYFMQVISRLAALKLVAGQYEEARLAIKSIYKQANGSFKTLLYGIYYLFKSYLSIRFPKLRQLKRSLPENDK